ncbi:hypothetical protein DSO57_1002386 [Entomophthora muscae]|uniref:Uncharacterized protein n=1 Tax=Entomophthora muscae TaxID=34485 RepID=A0ACC2RNS2_9FUNG|nr:hypothetical protein DSO57_1002386 [Entomophthora muscae]
MTYLPKESVTRDLQQLLLYKLQHGFKKSLNKATLDMIQLFLVILHGLNHLDWASKLAWQCYSRALNCALCLGLHKKRSTRFPFLSKERETAYADILYYNCRSVWFLGSEFIIFVPSQTNQRPLSKKHSFDLGSNFLIGISSKYELETMLDKLQSHSVSIVSDCHYQASCFLISLLEVRRDIINGIGSTRELGYQLASLQICLRDIFIDALKELEMIKYQIRLLSLNDHQILLEACNVTKTNLELKYRYLYNDTLVLSFYLNSNPRLPPLSKPVFSSNSEQIEKTFDNLVKIIHLEKSLGNAPYARRDLVNLSKAIIFLIRYSHLSRKEPQFYQKIIHSAKSLLLQLSSYSVFKRVCSLLLRIVEVVVKKDAA